jgi:hypothetical protein
MPDMRAGDGPRAEGGGSSGGMSFFVTSVGTGMMGGNMGGLAGADMKCQMLAEAAGVMGKTWKAYLSADAAGGQPAVNARDRIGTGPWVNQKGVTVATSIENLHSNNNMLGAVNSVDEKGAAVPGGQHDIMTGSTAAGMLQANATCNNWTSNTTMHVGRVGHVNKNGGGQNPMSWNSAHDTPDCTPAAIARVAGAARTYCFATN